MINYRVKVKAGSSTELTAKGLAVNIADCAEGEYWVVGPDEAYLADAVQALHLDVITPCQKIPN